MREYTPNLPDVACEKTKIQQVILNLLKNAGEAMAESAKREALGAEGEPENDMRHVPCANRGITLRILQDGDMARIELEDNGPGMNEEDRKQIFEPFFTTKDVGEGIGLGLSVSYFIITENHGGTISVESAEGRGTKFIIQLPLGKSA